MRNFSSSISFFLSSRTSENARTRAISKTRDKISFLIQNRRSKNSAQKTASSVQRSFALSIKNSKKQQTNFTEQRKQRKNSKKKKKSVGKELDASLCCADLYSPLSLKIKCSRLREEGLPLRNEDIEAFSEEEEILVVVLSKTLKKQTTF